MADSNHPIEGETVLLAGVKASVTLARLSTMLERAHEVLGGRRDRLIRQYERIDANGRSYVLADEAEWESLGADLDLTRREADALRRAHAAQFRRDGRRSDRRAEFERTLEIREPVVLGEIDDATR